jgi:nucleotide-binding universal stress UspA family protein
MSGERPIVIFYDGSRDARAAVAEAARLFPGGRATVVHIWESLETTIAFRYSLAGMTGALDEVMQELDASGAKAAARIGEEGAQLAREAGLQAEPAVERAHQRAWACAVEWLEGHPASVVVVGSRGVGRVSSMLLGSFSSAMVHRARLPVLVIPAPERPPAS